MLQVNRTLFVDFCSLNDDYVFQCAHSQITFRSHDATFTGQKALGTWTHTSQQVMSVNSAHETCTKPGCTLRKSLFFELGYIIVDMHFIANTIFPSKTEPFRSHIESQALLSFFMNRDASFRL